jgi:hypothetical protein
MNGAALPSMIGTSAEFNSMMTLSTPRLTSAASRCSTVLTLTVPAGEAGRQIDGAKMADVGGNFDTAKVGTPETDTEIGRRGLEGKSHLLARMETDSGAGDRSTKCPLCVHQC